MRCQWRCSAIASRREFAPTRLFYCGLDDPSEEASSSSGDGVAEAAAVPDGAGEAPSADAAPPDVCHFRMASNFVCFSLGEEPAARCDCISRSCMSFSFSARMARTRDGSGISARSSGGSCCSLFSLSACSCAEPPPAGGGVRAKPVPARAVLLCRFARAFSLSFKAVSRRFNSRSRSSTAFSRASSSALRRARSAPASCFWQEQTSAKQVTIKMPRFLFIRA